MRTDGEVLPERHVVFEWIYTLLCEGLAPYGWIDTWYRFHLFLKTIYSMKLIFFLLVHLVRSIFLLIMHLVRSITIPVPVSNLQVCHSIPIIWMDFVLFLFSIL